jgi:hypothetical protein
MTEPRERQTDATLKVEPEVIQDLDVIGDDADNIVGGSCCFSRGEA